MSWQSYVDNNLVATGKVSKGAIFGLDGSTWAITPGFEVNSLLPHLFFSHSSFREADEERLPSCSSRRRMLDAINMEHT